MRAGLCSRAPFFGIDPLLQLSNIVIDKYAANDVPPEVNATRQSPQHPHREPQCPSGEAQGLPQRSYCET